MDLLARFRTQRATSRISEELLYAEALRELERGMRRDGLWAKAHAESNGDQSAAQALYLKLRVQSLRDEIEVLAGEKRDAERIAERERKERVAQERGLQDQLAAHQSTSESKKQRDYRNRPVTSHDWGQVIAGAGAVMFVVVLILYALSRLSVGG